jgi:hypothetical protein
MTDTAAITYPPVPAPPPATPRQRIPLRELVAMNGRSLATDFRAIGRYWHMDDHSTVRATIGSAIAAAYDGVASVAEAALDTALDTLEASLTTPLWRLPEPSHPDYRLYISTCGDLPPEQYPTSCDWDQRRVNIRRAWRETPLRVRLYACIRDAGIAEAFAEVRAELHGHRYPPHLCSNCGVCQCLGCQRRRAGVTS